MKRRDFLENTALGALLAPILGVFGVESPEKDEKEPEKTEIPEKPRHIRVIDRTSSRLKLEVAYTEGTFGGVAKASGPTPPLQTEIRSKTFTVGSLYEFAEKYESFVGTWPDRDAMLKVSRALEVPPPW